MDLLWEILKRKVSDPDGTRLGKAPPWHAKSVIVAGITSIAGFITWLNDHSPALLVIGASYIGGFFLGWMFRRFVKTAALITGGIILLIGGLKSTGLIALDWAAIEYSVNHSLSLFQEGAEGFKQILMGYLPSAGSGSAGIFFGFKRK
ncbi:MAG: hypothetical protein HKN08_02515 [Gammaproteobacteria bacterium]|nr:hypothetical protein [Gammaproteobacteria bacterium]